MQVWLLVCCGANFSQGHDIACRCWIETRFCGHTIWASGHPGPLAKARVPSTFNLFIIYDMTEPATYCALCPILFSKMGACPHPEKTIIYAYLSLLPYLIPVFVFLFFLFTRKLAHFKVVAILGSGYIIGDKVLKNIFRSPRPQFACKKSFGFPSSHMFVMVSIAYYRIRNPNVNLGYKILWVFLTIGQGIARVQLNYHTFAQVIGGIGMGIIYTQLFHRLWEWAIQKFWPKSSEQSKKQ